MSIIATVMIMMILALFAAIGVSLVTTGSNVAVQEERGLEAFYIADGGLQYAAKNQNFPNFVVASTNLGEGSFTTTVPTLSANITNAVLTITVSSTDGFTLNPADPTRYWTMLCDNNYSDNPIAPPNPNLFAATANCEKISFTGKTATTFTGGVRGRASSTPDTHQQDAVVLGYSWDTAKTTTIATRALNRDNVCTTAATTICVASTANFASSGFIRINNATENNIEDVFYDGIGSGAVQCGAGCAACLGYTNPFPPAGNCIRRAYDDDNLNRGIVTNNAVGTIIYQSEISVLATSTGVVPGAILTGNIKRVVQGKIMPLQ